MTAAVIPVPRRGAEHKYLIAFAVVLVSYALAFLWFVRGWKRHGRVIVSAVPV